MKNNWEKIGETNNNEFIFNNGIETIKVPKSIILEKESTIIHKVLLAETIVRYIEKIKRRICGDFLWYELLKTIDKEPSEEKLEQYLNLMFKLDKEDFRQIQKNYQEEMEHIEKWKIL